jgi:hypothetical protein
MVLSSTPTYQEETTMRRRTRVVLAAAVAAGVIALISATLSSNVIAEQEKPATRGKDVILVRCSTSGMNFTTTAYQGSAAAPSRRSESCPETLSILLRDGFTIFHVAHSDIDADYLVYTLLRE